MSRDSFRLPEPGDGRRADLQLAIVSKGTTGALRRRGVVTDLDQGRRRSDGRRWTRGPQSTPLDVGESPLLALTRRRSYAARSNDKHAADMELIL